MYGCWSLFYKYIPVLLEDARFRKSERFIIKAHFFIKGYSLKKKCNAEYGLLSLPQGAGLETLYAALLILRRGQPFSSINALPKDVSNSS
ncbi:hypothetical protein A9Q75_00035 [Colwellia psychrerythraea]|uniref:Uncharacterized protein n=1 Tax=Colwellia psychrerythraea TaxID=28229 RepID=A0A1Y5EX51_COLPS|nr:hypothetical protein A9Q75_00035 [Colwellia psychrerythraea]